MKPEHVTVIESVMRAYERSVGTSGSRPDGNPMLLSALRELLLRHAHDLLAASRQVYDSKTPRRESSEDASVLPDGSAFCVGSLPLPKDHWMYAPRREWDNERGEYAECPRPILTHAMREHIVTAARYAIRGATMCGKLTDFDPDALVKNMVYALCGPYGTVAAPQTEPEPTRRELSDEELLSAISRGWRSPANASKDMDVDLALAIANEVRTALRAVGGEG